MGLKEFYYRMEDKWYKFVERTGLYKITDKIDKVMPSFLLFILLIIIFIAAIILFVVPLIFSPVAGGYQVQFKVIDAESGSNLSSVPVMVTTSKEVYTITTNEEGITDPVNVPKNQTFSLDVDYQDYGYAKYSNEYIASTDNEIFTIPLEILSAQLKETDYEFTVINSSTSQQILKNGRVTFRCVNGIGTSPAAVDVINGKVNVSADPNCSLYGNIIIDGFNPKYDVPITSGTTNVYLDPSTGNFQAGEYTVSVYVKGTSGDAISNIKAAVFNDIGINVSECITNTGGNCVLENVASGTYTLRLSDNRAVPIYSNYSESLFVDSDTTKYFNLITENVGYIRILVVNNANNNKISGAYVALKVADQTIMDNYTDANGEKLFVVSDKTLNYRVVVDANGYMIKSSSVTVHDSIPITPLKIRLDLVTPNTLAVLNLRVIDDLGKGYRFAKVALYDSETGFLTDYQPVLTNYDGNAHMHVTSGKYYAVAIKGASRGESASFDFDVRQAETYSPIIIPMNITKGTLAIKVVDKEDAMVPNAKVTIYDRFSYMDSSPPIAIKSDLTNSSGEISFELDAENDYFAVVTDPINEELGTAQSRFVRVVPNGINELKVVMYDKVPELSKPELILSGLYKNDLLVSGNLKAGSEYEARFTLFVPQDRSGDDQFQEVGAIIRTGNTVYLENDNLYIKSIDVPNTVSIQKYTQYDAVNHKVDGIYDSDTLTDGDSKWAKVVFEEPDYVLGEDFCNTYEVVAIIKVRDSAVFGEELKLFYLGYGLNDDDDYETYNPYTGNEDEIEYFNVYSLQTYGIGDEILCSDDFCYSSKITDVSANLRYDVTSNFAAEPSKDYTLHFVLINNQQDKRYINSRLIIENKDEGLNFTNIRIVRPDGSVSNSSIPQNEYEFDYAITQLDAKKKVEGDINFSTELMGDRHIVLKFISDQKILFVQDLIITVNSNKEFEVSITPEIIPSGKIFNILVEARDSLTNIEVEDSYVVVKDRFFDVLRTEPIGVLGTVSINNLPAQGVDDLIYVYVSAPEYKTYIKEIKISDNLFSITPKRLGFSLNINNERMKTETFTITNISELDLEVEDLVIKGDNLDIIDLDRLNNELAGYVGLIIEGLDTTSNLPDNSNSTKTLDMRLTINPRANGITEVQNMSAKLKVSLKPKGETSPVWVSEIPITITVGFDGVLDDSACLVLTENTWKDVALGKPVEKQFIINNKCTINGKTVPLTGGLEVKVEYESSPLGKLSANINNRLVELSSGYYKTIVDGMDRDVGYPVVLKYEPQGRMQGNIKGKIIFRSINPTASGNQEIRAEYNFDISVINLEDCYVISKKVLELYKTPDTFTIENKGCGKDTIYRLSCDDCRGIVLEPKTEINVPETGTSETITVTSMDAIPGQYLINIYSKIKDARGSERNVGQIKVHVRPINSCLDLDRYEFDLYRRNVSENTGDEVNAKSYDTANIINICYQQEVIGKGKIKESSRLGMALIGALRDGVYTWAGSSIAQFLAGKDSNCSLGEIMVGKTGEKCSQAKNTELANNNNPANTNPADSNPANTNPTDNNPPVNNDNDSLEFGDLIYMGTIYTNSPLSIPVAQVSATYQGTSTEPIIYSISSGNGSNYFAIDSTGLIKTSSDNIPADTYTLTAKASKGNLNKVQTVQITVNAPVTPPITNTAPVFNSNSYSFEILNTASVGTVVGSVSATDPESDSIVYSLISNVGEFIINSSTGEITTNSTDIVSSEYILTVQASDSILSVTETVIINVNDDSQ